jgi:predicted permease
MTLIAASSETYRVLTLVIGAVAAVAVAALLAMLLLYIARIQRSVEGLLGIAGGVAANTENIPQLQATAPVLEEIVDEAVVQDGYMNALTDGFGDSR